MLGPAVNPLGALAGGDWTDLHYPFFQFTHEMFAREGRLPFWNPYIFSGQPHLVSLNVLALYPTELGSLFVDIEPSTFYALDLMAHLWLAGTGMLWWLRRSGRSPSAAFMGGLCYMLGGHLFTLVAAGHPHWVRSLAWLPLMFACLEEGRLSGRLAWFAGAGALLALPALTISMQFVAFALLISAAWILCPFSLPSLPARSLRLAVLGGVVAGLSAVIWVPGLEYYAHSVRAKPEPGLSALWALSPWDAIAFLLPEIWGTLQPYFGPHLFRSSTDYPGLLPLALAVIGGAAAWRTETRWVILAAAGVLLALGPATPVGEWLAQVPVFSGFRTPLRWLSFTHLAACVLAARGWDEILSGRKRGAVTAAGLLLVFGVVAWTLSSRAPRLAGAASLPKFVAEHLQEGRITQEDINGTFMDSLKKGAVSGVVTAGALGMLVVTPLPFALRAVVAWGVTVTDLLVSSARYFIFAPAAAQREPGPVMTFLLSPGREGGRLAPSQFRVATDEYFGLPNRRMYHGLHWISGYHGLPLARYRHLLQSALSASSVAQLSVLNVRYIVTTGPAPQGAEVLATIDRGDGGRVTIFAHPAPLPRAFLAGGVIPCDTFEDVLEEMNKPGWVPSRMPTDSPLVPALLGARLATRGSIACKYGQDDITASVSLPGDGLLVFSEVWYPAWKAYVDAVRVPVLRAYGALRALAVPAGEHTVRMTYDSWSFKIGLWLSCCTAAALLITVSLSPLGGRG